MKNVVKLLALVLCVCLMMSVVACGSKPVVNDTPDTTEKTWPIPTVNDEGPNENQCAGDLTATEETDYPTEPSVPETTAEEAPVDETTQTEFQPEEELPPVEEEIGDIQIPFPED